MKKTLILFCSMLASLIVQAQDVDPVLMHVNGKEVTRGEFEYEFNKNNGDGALEGTTVESYLPMFKAYKLKVEAAYDAKYDTLTSYKQEFRMYRDQLIRPMLVSEQDIEKQVYDYYHQVLWMRIGTKGLCHAAHIFIGMNQKATEVEQVAAKAKIDSIYTELKAGGDFEDLARKHSQDGSSVRGGDLGVFGPGQMVKEFEDVAYELADGTYSEPFTTPYGWHIVKTIAHQPLDPYEKIHDEIKAFLERQNIRERIANVVCDTLAKQRGLTMDQLMDEECDRICAENSEIRYLVQEYREGLLLFEICDREIWTPAKENQKGQERYFKKHKKNYTWSEPRYIGAVLQAQDETTMLEVKGKLRAQKDHSKWIDIIKDDINKDSVRVRIDYRLFAKGDNKWVDNKVFGLDEQVTASKKYPVVECVGKLLKKKAERWIDVRQQVQQDYQNYCTEQWVEQLKKRYTIIVDEEVLKTVNNH